MKIKEPKQNQGKLWDRYQIYVSNMQGTGLKVKTFDEWLNS